MKNGTYTFGTTPENVIRKALAEKGSEKYSIELVGNAAEAIVRVVNQGIDSHLEAVTDSTFSWETGALVKKLNCEISDDDMVVILRRLYETNEEEEKIQEEMWNLRSDVLSSLEIEEI